jgi:cytoskeletal protein CcmA (bactofilin family)
MREERGPISGDQKFYEPCNIWGSIAGNVTVIQGGKVYVRGAIYGNLEVEYGGRVHIFGNVSGNLIVNNGAKVIHSGVLGGDAINNGGRLFIEPKAKVMGKVKAIEGETKDNRPHPEE